MGHVIANPGPSYLRHTYIQRREILQQSMRKGIAFQAMKPLDPKRDWTQTRIERHFREHEKKDPSSYISCYDNLSKPVRSALDTITKDYSGREGQSRKAYALRYQPVPR